MLETITNALQKSAVFSIVVSAIVVLVIIVSVLTIYGKAKEEKEIERRRWDKISAHMALYDTSERVIIPLEADEILIGRHGAADIRLSDMSISRYHAVLYVSNGVWSIMDLDSKSGTYVNGRKVHVHKLKDMDEIRLGNKNLILRQRRR